MARNDSMAGQPPISISQTTRNTANTVFGQTAGDLAPTSSNPADHGKDTSQEDPEVILRGDSFTLLRGAEKRPFITSPNSSPEPGYAPLEYLKRNDQGPDSTFELRTDSPRRVAKKLFRAPSVWSLRGFARACRCSTPRRLCERF